MILALALSFDLSVNVRQQLVTIDGWNGAHAGLLRGTLAGDGKVPTDANRVLTLWGRMQDPGQVPTKRSISLLRWVFEAWGVEK